MVQISKSLHSNNQRSYLTIPTFADFSCPQNAERATPAFFLLCLQFLLPPKQGTIHKQGKGEKQILIGPRATGKILNS
jgi:hypothetical protein